MTSPAPRQALLSVRDLRVEFAAEDGPVVAVPNLSFDIYPGQSYGLVGESGCGKTTTAMAIMGYLGSNGRISRGQILFEDKDIVGAAAADLSAIRGRRMAMVYQEPMSALNPTMTIGGQLEEVPRRHLGATRAEARELAAAMLEDVRMPDPRAVLSRYPHQLSGGQQQRVVIAMALLARPALLLLDEPTTGLDVTVEAAVLDLIVGLREKFGTSLLYISHNLGVIATACDRVGIMYSGQMVEEADVNELFSTPRHPYTQGLIGCIPDVRTDKRSRALLAIPGQLPQPNERPSGCSFGPRCNHFVGNVCDRMIELVATDAAAHSVRCARWRTVVAPALGVTHALIEGAVEGEGLRVAGISKTYDVGGFSERKLVANEDLTFTGPKGEVLAIVGESGCGKSTFARILAGLEGPSKGTIHFDDTILAGSGAGARSKELLRSVQMIFQNPDSTLNPSHSVGWPIRRAIGNFGLRRTGKEIRERANALFEMVRLAPALAERRPNELSGGQKQRVAIARAFAPEPSLIVADEPVSALDVSVQAAIVTLLLDLQQKSSTTLVFISHDLALVRHIADRVVVMYLGRVMEQGTIEEVFQPPYHPYTEALLSAVHTLDGSANKTRRIRLTGETPSPVNLPAGCRFASRCPRKLGPICDTVAPPVRKATSAHEISCHIELDALATVASQVPAIGKEASS